MRLDHADRLCRQWGVRLTSRRCRVLEIICASGKPLGAYDILDAMRAAVPGVAPPTVYRALDFLMAQGLVHKLETLHAFIDCAHPGHCHAGQFLICAECGDVTELEDGGIARSLQQASEKRGFSPRRRIVEMLGTCAHCVGPPQP